MSFQPSNLFRWTGTVNRLPYFLAGVTLLVVKFAMDWVIARLIFERDWTLTNYLAAPTNTLRVFTLADPDRVFLGTLLVLALPFIFIGIAPPDRQSWMLRRPRRLRSDRIGSA